MAKAKLEDELLLPNVSNEINQGRVVPAAETAASSDEKRDSTCPSPTSGRQKKNKKGEKKGKGISPSSPFIYLTAEEKKHLERYQAHLLLQDGEKKAAHEILMSAFKYYLKHTDKEFYQKYHGDF